MNLRIRTLSIICTFVSLAPAQQSTFTSNVKVVNVLATVRDRDGRIVANLNKGDFTLEEDGRPQTIKYFSQQSDRPLSLGFMVDTSGSVKNLIPQERKASASLLENAVRFDIDSVYVLQFDINIFLVQNFTNSKQKLRKALASLPADPPMLWDHIAHVPFCGGRGTLLYTALAYASSALMHPRTGRKAMVLITDGVDDGSCESVDSAIEYLQRSDTIVYGIYNVDADARRKFEAEQLKRSPEKRVFLPDGARIVRRICDETGGRYFELDPTHSLAEIYSWIQQELHNQYSLGYTPERHEGEGYRKIRLTTKRPDLVVQARGGYYFDAR